MILAVLLLIAVLIWMFVTFRSRQQVRFCRWRANRDKDGPEGRYFVCMACGAETRVAGAGEPTTCLRPVPPGEA